MARPIALAASTLLLLATSLACGAGEKVKEGINEMAGEKLAEQVLEGTVGGDVNVDAGANVDLSDLPPILRPPNATAKGRMSMTNEGGTGTLYQLDVTGTTAEVVSWFKNSLASWKLATELSTGDGTMLLYASPDESHNAQIQVSSGEAGHASVSVLYVAKFKTPPTP
ncbi:MAG: hypothetical protein JXB39_01075 [Deltaproteobacteria bacterium]|nr:hypothetical protein [Deltaproteobacteria bacterium]